VKIIFVLRLEANQLASRRSYRGIRASHDVGMRRSMSTILELSAEQAQTPTDDFHLSRDETRTSLSPLAQGKLISNLRIEVDFMEFQEHYQVSFQQLLRYRKRLEQRR
jgi:hypothetical protein